MTKQEIRDLISNDRLDEAINALRKITEQGAHAHLYQQVGTISANYKSYKKRAATGQLSFQEQNQGTATIANGLLSVVDEIWKDENYVHVPPTSTQSPIPIKKQPYLWYVLGGIGTLLTAFGIWYYVPPPTILEAKTTQPVVFKLHNENGSTTGSPKITGKIILNISLLGYKDTAYINEENNRAVFENVPLKALRMMAEATLVSNDYIATIGGKSLRIDTIIDYPVIRRKNTPIVAHRTEETTNGGPQPPPADPPKVYDLTKVVLFEKPNYKGEGLELKDGINSLKNENALNGKVSSIRIPKGFHVLLSEQDNGSGKAIILTESASNLAPYNFDNRVSFVDVKEVNPNTTTNRNGKIWIPEHFELGNGSYLWRQGSWTTPPQDVIGWKEATWDKTNTDKFTYIQGTWIYTTRRNVKASDLPPPPVIQQSPSPNTRVPKWVKKN